VGAGVYVSRGMAWCKNSTFDGGAETTDYGVECFGTVYCEDCDFGQTTAHDKADVRVTAGIALLRNCNLGSAGVIGIGGGVVFEEDAGGVKGAQKHTSQNGTVTKDTGVTRSGGADSSAKIEPNTKTGLYNPLTLNGIEANFNFPFKIWTAAALTTITVYIRSLGTWGTYPTASELYIEASYLDHATNATRTTVVSNDVLSDSTSWVAFDVTFTPLQAGFVYLNVYLKKYEASKGCYVDIKPVVT